MTYRLRIRIGFLLLGTCLLILACDPEMKQADLIIGDATLYTQPGEETQMGHIIIHEDTIREILPASATLPPGKRVIDGKGLFATAGFWNLHVHFSHPKWFQANQASADSLQLALDDMLNQYGFTAVLDIGSELSNTLALRERVLGGELLGPKILTAGSGFVMKGGSPAYLEVKLPEFLSAENARMQVAQNIQAGADHIKIFTGSFLGVGQVSVIPPAIAKAAVEEAHKHQSLVASHPQSLEGLESAVFAGVDMLAHTAPDAGKLTDSLLLEMKKKDILMVPTLKLWRWELGRANLPDFVVDRTESAGVAQVRDYLAVGGKIAFGTDVGYMSDYNTAQEYQLMAKAGMSFDQILAALTTIPEGRFGEMSKKGKLLPGQKADIVLLAKDPKSDAANFAEVSYTIRSGAIIFEKHE